MKCSWKIEEGIEMKKTIHVALTLFILMALLVVGYLYFCGNAEHTSCFKYETGLSFSR